MLARKLNLEKVLLIPIREGVLIGMETSKMFHNLWILVAIWKWIPACWNIQLLLNMYSLFYSVNVTEKNCIFKGMKFSIKDFSSKSDQICSSFLQIMSHLLKKFLSENFIFLPCIKIAWFCNISKISFWS